MRVANLKKIIETFLNNNKASNIISIDLKKKSHIADYMIIASGTSSRHLQSLSENLILELKKTGMANCRMEGKYSEDWKLVDAIDIIVHLFHPEKRNFYDLEKMWSEPTPKEKAMI
ncbi:MAG: ribosome silencing factor [Pelagibacteraceae bacterium TMED216]|nr:MAG: ribosome silencing factor [Pelagibacteraceae bacterium TMED216]|tara:strand:+ start:105 stop:452 length:348 start_codon:yes stop_codon:yes gene_type:complete